MSEEILVTAVPHSCGTEISYPAAWDNTPMQQFFLLRHVLDCPDTSPEQLISATELYFTLLPQVERIG